MELRRPCGADYLAAVTHLLHTQRARALDAGLWEAADLQWWYTRDQHPEPDAAAVWYDRGEPVAATVLTRWNQDFAGVDVLGDTGCEPAWQELHRLVDALPEADVEMALPAAEQALVERAAAVGFVAVGERLRVGRIVAAEWRRTATVPPGFRVLARADGAGSHPLGRRNGPEVEDRLRQCPLYDPTCDLAIVTDAGEVAGYALFWPDRVSGVGLVEPVRIEDAYAGRGLATALVQDGVERLIRRGCRHVKVMFGLEDPSRARLYGRAGFTDAAEAVVRRRPKR